MSAQRSKATGWRKVASAVWGSPSDPQIYGDIEVDAEALLGFIQDERKKTETHVTVTHVVGKAVANALGEHPELNTYLSRGRFVPHESVDIFFVVAVAGGRDLSGVKVRGADRKSVPEIAEELSNRAARIRTGDDVEFGRSKRLLDAVPIPLLRLGLRVADRLVGDYNVDLDRYGLPREAFGSAMVTSVGMFGVQRAFGPLSPYYRIPLLALVGEVTPKPVVVDGEIVARPIPEHLRDDGSPVSRRVARRAAREERPRLPRGSGMNRPWLDFYGDVPATLDYPEIALHEAVTATVERVPDAVAFDFFGRTATYRELGESIDRCATAFAALGVGPGERVTISMPTSPQGVIAFYAVTKLGAVASMIHPLSTTDEIEHYLNLSGSRFAMTLDAFYDRFASVRTNEALEALVLTRISDYLPRLKRPAFWLTRGRKIPSVPEDSRVRWWSQVMREKRPPARATPTRPHELAAILYSGGTTGKPKGIMLSHYNFVSEGKQVAAWVGMNERDTVLAVLPIFHGFGLGALIHAGLSSGARLVLVPQFSPEIVAKLIRAKRPTLMAGVPTLYEALARDPSLQKTDLSCLRAAFCGADTLTRPVKERFEGLVRSRGGSVRLLEGYGLTEAVTAVMGTPLEHYREGSVGVPFPDMLATVCRPDTTEELGPGEEGEICLAGPPVMLGYLDDPAATAETLRRHDDGRIWLHTGDIGRRDEDGFFYFAARLKRMIKSSGMNVYPAQVEAVLLEHPAVEEACVVGVPDEAQGERVKAYVVPKDPEAADDELARELIAHCRERLIKWSCPRDVDFRDELPKTRVGKVDFAALTREAAAAAR